MENAGSTDDLCTKVPNRNFIPIPPTTVEETQLDFSFLADLTLKTVYADANCSTTRIAKQLCLPVPIARLLLEHLYNEKLIEIRGQISHIDYRYAILERGWQRANRLLDLSSYIGPAPVSLQSYAAMVSQQSKDRPAGRPAGGVLKQLSEQTDIEKDHFVFLAGMKYRKYLIPHITSFEVPLEGMPIGKQLHYLSEQGNEPNLP